MSDASAITLEAFEACAIPHEKFNHRAHLTVAYLMLRAGAPAEAERRMCAGIQRYNASQQVQQTPTGGYHETLTIAWIRVLAATMAAYGTVDGPDEFLAQHPHLLSKVLLRLFYSRETIMSDAARHGWVEPDLAPLPRIIS